MSHAYDLIMNIRAAATHHQRTCPGPPCGVSLILLLQACYTLKQFADPGERDELDRVMAE